MPRKLTDDEIQKKRELMDALFITRKMLNLELEEAEAKVKRLKYQIKESIQDQDTLQEEILNGIAQPAQVELLT